MKFRHNLLAIILLFFVGSVLAVQHHVDEQSGDASMHAAHTAEGNKLALQHAAAQSQQQANIAFTQGDTSMNHASAADHYASGHAYQQAANNHAQNAGAHQNNAYGHFNNAEGHYQNAIIGRMNNGHIQGVDALVAKRNEARAGKNRNQ